MTSPRRLLAVVLVPFVLVTGYLALALPPYGGTDEGLHARYVEFVRTERRSPDPFLDRVGNDKHPPFYYAVAAGVVALVEPFSTHLPDRVALPGPFVVETPLKERCRAEGVDFSGASILALRFLSILFALAAIAFSWACVRLVLPDAPRAAAGAAALLAFNPGFLFQASVLNNDAAAVAASAAAAWLLLRGLAGQAKFRPLLAGAVAGAGFFVKANDVFLLPVGLAVLWERRRREGARPLRETAFFVAGWAAVAGPWIARNLVRLGEPLGVGGVVATWGRIFFPGPRTARLVDESVASLFPSFWEPIVNVSAGRTLVLLLQSAVAFAVLGAGLRLFHRKIREEAPEQAAPLRVSLLACAVVYALVAVGNLSVPSTPGRLLFPSIPFLAVIFAAGLPVVFRSRADFLALPILGVASAVFGTAFLFRVLLPSYWIPKSALTPDTIAYVDCGHRTAEKALVSGQHVWPHFLHGEPKAAYTQAIGADRVEYEVAGLDPAVPMTVEVTYASSDVTYDDRTGPGGETIVNHVVQRLRAGEVLVHGAIAVTHLAKTRSFRLPAAAIREGRVRLSFEKVAGLFATVSEIRVRRTSTTVAAARAGRQVRVAVAGAEPSPTAFLSCWLEDAAAPGRVLERHLHAAKGRSFSQSVPLPDLRPGRYRFHARLVDPERSPFAVVEGESLAHAGWWVFSDPGASGRYMIRATKGWTKPEARVPVAVGDSRPGVYLARLRYSASPAGGGAAFGSELAATRDRWEEANSFVTATGESIAGEIDFRGRGRLALDRVSFAPAAGPCAEPDASIEFEIP